MSCRRIDGYTLNRAATLLAGRYEFLVALIREVGLGDRLRYADFKIGTLRDGVVHPVRTNHVLRDSVCSKLLGWRSKLLMMRLLRDVEKLRPLLQFDDLGRAADYDVESAEAYALRRLNREICDYVVDPAMAALLTVPAAEPSSIDMMFTVAHYLGAGAWYVDGGIDFLVQELASRVPVQTAAHVETVDERRDGVTLRWRRDGQTQERDFDGVVIATSAHAVPPMYAQLSATQRRILDAYEYITILAVHLGLNIQPQIDADFVQIPYRENPTVANLVLAQRQQRNMAPPGKGLIVAYFRDEWSKAHFALDDATLLDRMLPAIEPLVPGLRGAIEMSNIERWQPALFKSRPGSYKLMAQMRATLDTMRRVHLAGDYFSFTSTNASALSGDAAAKRLLGFLRS